MFSLLASRSSGLATAELIEGLSSSQREVCGLWMLQKGRNFTRASQRQDAANLGLVHEPVQGGPVNVTQGLFIPAEMGGRNSQDLPDVVEDGTILARFRAGLLGETHSLFVIPLFEGGIRFFQELASKAVLTAYRPRCPRIGDLSDVLECQENGQQRDEGRMHPEPSGEDASKPHDGADDVCDPLAPGWIHDLQHAEAEQLTAIERPQRKQIDEAPKEIDVQEVLEQKLYERTLGDFIAVCALDEDPYSEDHHPQSQSGGGAGGDHDGVVSIAGGALVMSQASEHFEGDIRFEPKSPGDQCMPELVDEQAHGDGAGPNQATLESALERDVDHHQDVPPGYEDGDLFEREDMKAASAHSRIQRTLAASCFHGKNPLLESRDLQGSGERDFQANFARLAFGPVERSIENSDQMAHLTATVALIACRGDP